MLRHRRGRIWGQQHQAWVVQRQMRHESIRTTQVYCSLTDVETERTFDEAYRRPGRRRRTTEYMTVALSKRED
jgi:integrase